VAWYALMIVGEQSLYEIITNHEKGIMGGRQIYEKERNRDRYDRINQSING